MAELATPTVRLRRFGAELRAIREERGLSIQAVARRVDRSDSALSKLENGRTFMLPRDVNQVPAGYGVIDPATGKMLHTLMRDGRKKGWWQHYSDALSPAALDFMRLESDASSIWSFQTIVLPGLVQTEEYARAVIDAGARLSPRNVDRLLSIRMKRQQVMQREHPPRVSMVIDEAALRRPMGDRRAMRAQLAHLAEFAQRDPFDLRVLPFAAGPHVATSGPFVSLGFDQPAGMKVVFLENLTGVLWVEQDEDVRQYGLAFQHLQAAALATPDSLVMIERIAAEL